GQASEIIFQGLFAEGNAGEAQEVILEIIQIPGDRLPIETSTRITHLVIQLASRLDLKSRQRGDDFSIGFDRRRSDLIPRTMPRQKFKQRRVPQILFEISPLI